MIQAITNAQLDNVLKVDDDGALWCKFTNPLSRSEMQQLEDAHKKGVALPMRRCTLKERESFRQEAITGIRDERTVVTGNSQDPIPHKRITVLRQQRFTEHDNKLTEIPPAKRTTLCEAQIYMFQGFCTGCCCKRGLLLSSQINVLTLDNMQPEESKKYESCTTWYSFVEWAVSITNGMIRVLNSATSQQGRVCRTYFEDKLNPERQNQIWTGSGHCLPGPRSGGSG